MKRFKKILVATDTRFADHPIVQQAAEIALRNNASLKIVDVVPEFPWTVRMTLANHEHMRELIAQEKKTALEALAEPIRQTGVEVETQALLGKTSIEIIREVIRGGYDLVLRVAKGRESTHQGFFGNTGKRLLRKCPCAVWLVAAAAPAKFQQVLGCVDTSSGSEIDAELNDQVYELASSIGAFYGARFSLLHAWSIWNEQMIRTRMKPAEFEVLEKTNHDQIAALLDKFLETHGTNIRADNIQMVKGDPPAAIAEFVCDNHVDLVVMGTVARSGVTGMFMGNTAEQILDRIECSVLALKPSSFVSPIRLDD
ncbi:universal stress protein [Lignipirellula cremea]|uniref:Universal stress protein E n=1 Tax=Lignipirellula cremea TaxID=2528010 RepID=A0A518DLC5_9BACT|nr:universal stress protein [Lignipirellula cremea]QDU92636.1 Universal stress protein E [Lignipirellula cremea]